MLAAAALALVGVGAAGFTILQRLRGGREDTAGVMTVRTGVDTGQSGSGEGPRIAPPSEFEKFRIHEDTQIVPDDATVAEMQAAGVSRVLGSFKLCQMERWEYRPITIADKPVSLCTTTTFIYTLE